MVIGSLQPRDSVSDFPFPKVPTGFSPEATFDQKILAAIKRLFRLIDSPGAKWSVGERGISLNIQGLGGATGANTYLYAVTELFADGAFLNISNHFNAQKVDPNTGEILAGSTVAVAKCLSGRMPVSEVIDGTEIDYLYTDDNTRIAASEASASERQVMHPRYIVPPIVPTPAISQVQWFVYVVKLPGSGASIDGQQVQYLEVQPNRYWARAIDQSGV